MPRQRDPQSNEGRSAEAGSGARDDREGIVVLAQRPLTFVAYGLPYFRRLPRRLAAAHMPRLAFDKSRFALEEAVPGPTDVSPLNPGISKRLYNVPVKIESNDMLFTPRSDSLANIAEVSAWSNGSDILSSSFVRLGAPAGDLAAQQRSAFLRNQFFGPGDQATGPICWPGNESGDRLTVAPRWQRPRRALPSCMDEGWRPRPRSGSAQEVTNRCQISAQLAMSLLCYQKWEVELADVA